ncbi:DnaA N-terminal domain-containing protein [Pseudalkalibacillus decolorationis]|uniref:DnaA N-terminal domain-containing protein n=1 Tax=Pseudalkalibacillus decolorationis TaxID=163879 RepID=UPI0021491CCE|nr:DnaA N-terminal domain-containing protein [Pseudalkalibacillus decolorationis]
MLNELHWDEVLSFIEEKLSRPSFDTWFKSTKGEIDGDTLTIVTGNDFSRDWLEARYRSLISEAFSKITGLTMNLTFKSEKISEDPSFLKDRTRHEKTTETLMMSCKT